MSSKPNGSGWNATRWRLAIASILTAAPIAAVVLSHFISAMEVCEELVADNGQVVRTCNPITAIDLPLLGLWVLLILLILLPDFSELSIPGLISLKREVRDVASAVDRVEGQISQYMSFNPTIEFHNHTASPAESTQIASEVYDRVNKNIPNAESQISHLLKRDVLPTRAIQEVQLLALWERLLSTVQTYGVFRSRIRNAITPDSIISPSWLSGWIADYYRDISEIRVIRNTVAHQPEDLSDEALRKALSALQSLVIDLDRVVAQNSR